jgi:hypothetical protein
MYHRPVLVDRFRRFEGICCHDLQSITVILRKLSREYSCICQKEDHMGKLSCREWKERYIDIGTISTDCCPSEFDNLCMSKLSYVRLETVLTRGHVLYVLNATMFLAVTVDRTVITCVCNRMCRPPAIISVFQTGAATFSFK